jgi:hypothetical protein
MLDVHPAHHAASTWRDFFIHIATIVLGLLIAIGLEQTVEHIHHNRQVAETREALRVERLMNANRFAVQTDDTLRFGPILQSNLDILRYIRQHPHSTADQWPGRLRWAFVVVGYIDSAWKTAEESTILQYMPRAEVEEYRVLYGRLDQLNQAQLDERQALYQARAFDLRHPDPTQLSLSDLDNEIEFTTQVIIQLGLNASEQQNLARRFPDFKPAPTAEQLNSIQHRTPDSNDLAAINALAKRITNFDAQFKHESAGNEEGNH